jgi:hypothetical protein
MKKILMVCFTLLAVFFMQTGFLQKAEASGIQKVVTKVWFTQSDVTPDVSNEWYDAVTDKINAKLAKVGITGVSNRKEWEEFMKVRDYGGKIINRDEAKQAYASFLKERCDAVLDVYVDRYETRWTGKTTVNLRMNLRTADDRNGVSLLSYSDSQTNLQNTTREEQLDKQLDDMLARLCKAVRNL